MPVQQSVDIGVPLETVYNQWTQFAEWPIFMHRITEVSQKDPCTVSFKAKIWGKTKEFEAKIETQRPDQRIKWEVAEGMSHSGVVTFHEITPTLTRVELGLDIEPGSMIEKAARGMRHVKRAARGDLHRFKAFIEMLEKETGAWRGVIEDGELVEDHDSSYDKKREYGSADELLQDDQDQDQDEDKDEEEHSRSGRQQRQSSPSRSSSRGSKGSSSGSRRKAGSSRNGSSGRSSGAKASSRSSSSRSASSSSKRSGSSGSRASSSRNGGSSGGSKSTRSRSRGSSNGSSGRSRSSSSGSHEGRRRTGSSRRS